MILRALPLFFAFLLMQVGGVMAVSACAGNGPRHDDTLVDASAMTCATGCCVVNEREALAPVEHACACLKSVPAEGAPPATSSIPVSSGRDLVPQLSWVPMATLELQLLVPSVVCQSWEDAKPADMRPSTKVALQVLHCAFLI